ncbi:MAG: J domain-containing protein [Spirochaetales bacterium]|nr:J domain-containing protein [Spirochaetales bacterium]
MLKPLSEEEKRALNSLGLFDCTDAVQLVQKEDVLKKQFRKKALKTHPDRAAQCGRDPEQMRRAFQNINDNYQILMDRIMAQKGVSFRSSKVHVRKESPNATKEQSVSVGFYKGRCPEKKLRFAEYLYYCKKISWEQLISALSWQYTNRPKLGELARKKGWMTDEQIIRILREKKSSQRFGLASVNLGYLTVDKCRILLGEQKLTGLPIGSYFTKKYILTEAQLKEQLLLFIRHNRKYRPYV